MRTPRPGTLSLLAAVFHADFLHLLQAALAEAGLSLPAGAEYSHIAAPVAAGDVRCEQHLPLPSGVFLLPALPVEGPRCKNDLRGVTARSQARLSYYRNTVWNSSS